MYLKLASYVSGELKQLLDSYISANFPDGLVRMIRNTDREGLIKARIKGWKTSKGEVVVFFDSHMEVNIDWLVYTYIT